MAEDKLLEPQPCVIPRPGESLLTTVFSVWPEKGETMEEHEAREREFRRTHPTTTVLRDGVHHRVCPEWLRLEGLSYWEVYREELRKELCARFGPRPD